MKLLIFCLAQLVMESPLDEQRQDKMNLSLEAIGAGSADSNDSDGGSRHESQTFFVDSVGDPKLAVDYDVSIIIICSSLHIIDIDCS